MKLTLDHTRIAGPHEKSFEGVVRDAPTDTQSVHEPRQVSDSGMQDWITAIEEMSFDQAEEKIYNLVRDSSINLDEYRQLSRANRQSDR